MTLAKVKNLYDQDFALWIEATVKQLKSGDLSQVDLENFDRGGGVFGEKSTQSG